MRGRKTKFLKLFGQESRNISIFGRESQIVCIYAESINQIFKFLKIVGRESGNIPNLVQKVETSMRGRKTKFLKIVGRVSRNISIFGRESRIVCIYAGSINQIFKFLKIVSRESGNIPNLVQKVETSMRGRKTNFLNIFGRESRNLSTFGRENQIYLSGVEQRKV